MLDEMFENLNLDSNYTVKIDPSLRNAFVGEVTWLDGLTTTGAIMRHGSARKRGKRRAYRTHSNLPSRKCRRRRSGTANGDGREERKEGTIQMMEKETTIKATGLHEGYEDRRQHSYVRHSGIELLRRDGGETERGQDRR
ncbi:hypothetical protein GUITHDRAFT_114204 [Guillardia theta CCMP2712]|uniref:Uncharacterized protein n=1 Tax=Guillardia theta (strain CCMP2712) TaxID=905079 RepID=L1ITY8_GUITC|nr:hypothetical protein GUITHDRAFT_114204 [Guillardia theta CCMP2712]EKX39708.1 hypothetical protein GUITHDRAFT_114204 [Guillardia theta CCMP2712]|eukprot:XP_005826688.1 hypothetical protein GUITHDRAFT_114204 [Guillardia theta CCMP2712]